MHFIHDEDIDLSVGGFFAESMMPATAHHNRVGDFYSNPLISLMNSFDISSHLPTTYYYYYYNRRRRHLSPKSTA